MKTGIGTGLLVVILIWGKLLSGQEVYSLEGCIGYALENNHNLKKSQLELQKSLEAHREILGSLLPQVSGSGSMNYNIQKPTFVMPNFINDMLPPASQDPNAAKYMTIEMGTDFSAGLGAALNQQLLNFSLFRTIDIAETAEKMAALGIESKEEDLIAQTASLYFGIQSTSYAAGQLDKSLDLLEKMIETMTANYENGLIKKVDVDRIKITRVNLLSQKSAIRNAIDVQKNLLKLQMGMEMSREIEIEPIDLSFYEQTAIMGYGSDFNIGRLVPYRILEQQEKICELQIKSVLGESLPTMSLGLNYQFNFIGDRFFSENYYFYPSSAIGLNLRIPIFSGLSKRAKLNESKIEYLKLKEDLSSLNQSLDMAFQNARIKLNDSRKMIEAQRENQVLAEEVFSVSEANFLQGLASLSDVLNANSSLIQSQINYADALNNYMKAYIELLKAQGTIRNLKETKQDKE